MLRIVLVVVALTAGGVAAWLALAMQAPRTAADLVSAPPAVPMQEVLVAASDLGPGQTLAKENLRWQQWPESALNSAFINRRARADALETLVGTIVRSHILAGEPVNEEKLIPANAGFLSAMLPSGKRAVAIRISAQNTAGGFILPRDRVDVITTVARDGLTDGVKEHISRTILTNVLVLAVDQSADERNREDKSKDDKGKDDKKAKAVIIGKTATLEVDARQAEILAASEATGSLSLALRSIADNADLPSIGARQPTTQQVRVIRAGRAESTVSQ